MPSLASLAKLALILGSVAQVAAHPKFLRPRTIEIRQAPAAAPAPAPAPAPAAPGAPPAAPAPPAASPAAAGGLTDTDILQL
jgi:hypothetical protein